MSNHFQRDTTIGADSVYCRAIIFEVAPEGGPTTIVREWSTIEGFNPEGVVEGSPGDVRVRVDTGQIWLKQSGFNTTTGWVVVSTGGGGGGGALPCDDDPLPPAPVASPGTSAEFSRCDHVHPEQAIPASPTPSDAAPLAPAAVPDPGVSAEYSRGDHVHPEQAVPDPSDADPLAPAAVADPGVSPDYSRADHVHPEQAVPDPSDADPLADGSADPGVSADYSRADHVHPAIAQTIRVLDSVGQLVISDTNSPTALYSFDIPANTLVATGMLRLTIDSLLFNNQLSRAFTMSVSLGGVPLYQSSMTGIAANATLSRVLGLQFRLRAVSLASVSLTGHFRFSTANAAVVGLNAMSSAMAADSEFASQVVAVDWTTPLTLTVTITLDLATTVYAWTRQGATLELLQT